MNKPEAVNGLCAAMDYITSHKISFWEKFFVVGFVLAYAISPVDLIPDVPVIGWIDDIGVFVLFVAFCKYRVNKVRECDSRNDVSDVTQDEKPTIELTSHEGPSRDKFFTFSQGNNTGHDGASIK